MDIDENKSGCAAAQEERGSPPDAALDREELEREERRKRIRAEIALMVLMDDVFSRVALRNSPKLVQVMLRVILDSPELNVVFSETQRDEYNPQGHSAELDIFAIDSDGKRYDLELQNDESQATPSRAVFYWALMASESLEKGVQNYDLLPEITVVFVTHTNKLFGGSKPIYRAKPALYSDSEEGELTNRMRIVYVNVDNRDPETKLGRLMHDLTCADPDEMYYREIADRVRECKTSDKEVEEMCNYTEKWYKEGVSDGIAEGEARGRAEGEARGKAEGEARGTAAARRSIAARMRSRNIDISVIADTTGLSIEEIENLPTEAA